MGTLLKVAVTDKDKKHKLRNTPVQNLIKECSFGFINHEEEKFLDGKKIN